MPPIAAGPISFKPPEGKSKAVGIALTAFAAFGGFLYGYDTGYISGVKAMDFWLETFGAPTGDPSNPYAITTAQDSLVTSILSAGTFLGALAAYPIGDKIGRRLGIVTACGVFSIGVALQTGVSKIAAFAAGRVFAGFGVGIVSCLVPMYQSECAPKWIRGGVVACYQWAITIGLLVAAVVVNVTKDINDHRSYRIPIAIQFIWATILSTGMMCLPESPKWLVLKGRDDEARRALGRLLSTQADSEEVVAELSEVSANLEHELRVGSTSYRDCFRNGEGRNGLRVWTGCALQSLQQLSGINFIFYYGTTFFQNSGISNPFIITIVIDVTNVGSTVPGIWAVDKIGRRTLLLYGAAIMCVCEFIVAIVGVTVSSDNMAGQRVLIAFVLVYIAAFASTWGPIAWVVTSEIYPLAIRGKAMSLSTASNWLWNFGIGYSTPYMVDSGPGNANMGSKVFFVWGSFCVICCLFTFFCIPETKGLSLEQVDILYQNSSIIGSNKYRRELLEAPQAGDHQQDYTEMGPRGSHHTEKVDKIADHV